MKNKKSFYLMLFIVLVTSLSLIFLLASKKRTMGYSLDFLTQKISKTLKNESEPKYTFAVLGDTHFKEKDKKDFQAAVNMIKKANVDIVLTTGDNLSSCNKDDCEEKMEDWKRELGELNKIIYPTIGNHDINKDKEYPYKIWSNSFDLPKNGPLGFEENVYSFDFQNSHFVILNSQKPQEHLINDVQLEWLDMDLENTNKKFKFVFFHEPMFPLNSKKGESLDLYPEKRDKLAKILSKHKVTVVFSGHEHLHSRTKVNEKMVSEIKNDFYQIITGNTNSFDHETPKMKSSENVDFYHENDVFLIVKVYDDYINIILYSTKEEIIDEFKIKKEISS